MFYGGVDDIASEVENLEREMFILEHKRRVERMFSLEKPDEDEEGNRFCLSCGIHIPPARVLSVGAVRCVSCQGKIEKQAKMYNTRGSIFS